MSTYNDATVAASFDPDTIHGLAIDALNKYSVPYRSVLYARIGGSHAYNTAETGSDTDIYVVFVPYTDEFVATAMQGPVQVPAVVHSPKDANEDVTLVELAKFLELLTQGNPHAIEAVFAEQLFFVHADFAGAWSALQCMRPLLANQRTFRSYLGNVLSELCQIRNLRHRDVPFHKHLYHALRLIMECDRLSGGLGPRIRFEGDERRALMRVRQRIRDGESTVESVLANVQARHDAYQAQHGGMLPHLPDNQEELSAAFNAVLLVVRMQCWRRL